MVHGHTEICMFKVFGAMLRTKWHRRVKEPVTSTFYCRKPNKLCIRFKQSLQQTSVLHLFPLPFLCKGLEVFLFQAKHKEFSFFFGQYSDLISYFLPFYFCPNESKLSHREYWSRGRLVGYVPLWHQQWLIQRREGTRRLCQIDNC